MFLIESNKKQMWMLTGEDDKEYPLEVLATVYPLIKSSFVRVCFVIER